MFRVAFETAGLHPENISHCLINIVDGVEATLWVNFATVLGTIAKKTVNAGESATIDSLADVRSASFPHVDLPVRGAVVYVFQDGWRRGLYFDFSMIQADPNRPIEDFDKLAGSLHAALIFRERIQMKPEVLGRMAQAGWFPFIRLPHRLSTGLYRDFELGWEHANVEAEIIRELSPIVPTFLDAWAKKPAFAPHMSLLRDAVRLFSKDEYAAASGLLLPKVEGVLRTLSLGSRRPHARHLRENLLARVRTEVTGFTAFLPEAFVRYLEDYYYAGFDLGAGDVPPSRHAFMHGVGPDPELAKPAYTLNLLLMLDQLFFYV